MRLSRFILGVVLASGLSAALAARDRVEWNSNWQFAKGDTVEVKTGATTNNRKWVPVTLPHDWSIESKVDEKAPMLGAGGFFEAGIGWYRRDFEMPSTWQGKQVVVEFESVYMDAEVWINGTSIAKQPYGYTTFFADLTPYLIKGKSNTLLVRVNNADQPNSRWYTGSGIYRPVWLHISDPVRVAPWGVFVTTTALDSASATIRIETTTKSDAPSATDITVETIILNPKGKKVATATAGGSIAAGKAFSSSSTVELPAPQPWSPETPVLYRAVTRILSGKRVLDEVSTPFGVRTVQISAERGFELNGKSIKLVGGNLHHDNGPLGAAAFTRAEERKAELLKAAGFNAVRTSHNPPSPAFLDACDRLGLLVMDESFDGWKNKKNPQDYGIYFDEWSLLDLKAMVLRDRNHPSIVMWSVGNEMYERGNAEGLRIAHELTRLIRQLDSSRPVTAGINGMGKNGDWTQLDPLFATFDIAGYNYELQRHAEDHKRLPRRVMMSTETYLSDTFANWAIVHDNPYVVADFVWSAMDYLGEAGIGRVFPPGEPIVKHWEGIQFPWHGAACGDLDLTGWRKPDSHYRNIVWDRGEKLYAAVLTPAPGGGKWGISPWAPEPMMPSWTWPGHEGEPLRVDVYSRYDSIKLYLNGKLLGEKPTTRAEEFKAVFEVPYAAGKLEAVGMQSGREMERFVLKTAGAPASIRLTADRSQLVAGQQDLAFVTVEVLDKDGVLVPQADTVVRYDINGPATIAGVGSADLTTSETYQANPRRAYQGRALVVIRTGEKTGTIKFTASATGLAPAEITLTNKTSH